MPEQFLHGVEVVEIDNGARPIRTVRSSVIGIVGTAPDSQAEVAATLATGVVGSNNALTWTSELAGELGNEIAIELVDPESNSSALAITVDGRKITVSLATSNVGAITTTATALIAAIAADEDAAALVSVDDTGANTGAGAVAAMDTTFLDGGVDEAFPLNTPVLVANSRSKAALLGERGTLPDALDGIFDQAGAVVVVVRGEEAEDLADTVDNVIGDGSGDGTGMYALLGAESKLGVAPRILIAPGFTSYTTGESEIEGAPVVAEMVGIADRLRAMIVADGPNTDDEDAIAFRDLFGSARVFVVDPAVKVFVDGETIVKPVSDRVAGVMARIDNDRGFWWSPSNQEIYGIVGVGRSVDFQLGDANCRANILNENEVATIIRKDGYRLWGNRTCSSDPKWAFVNVRRTADIINESILRAHMWAVDRNITKTYFEDVVAGVNAYLANLQAQGAILGGRCWADPDLNSPVNLADGKVYFNFDFTAPAPAEHVTFRSQLVNDYFTDVLG